MIFDLVIMIIQTTTSIRVFFLQTLNIGNNTNIGIRGFIMWTQKIPITK